MVTGTFWRCQWWTNEAPTKEWEEDIDDSWDWAAVILSQTAIYYSAEVLLYLFAVLLVSQSSVQSHQYIKFVRWILSPNCFYWFISIRGRISSRLSHRALPRAHRKIACLAADALHCHHSIIYRVQLLEHYLEDVSEPFLVIHMFQLVLEWWRLCSAPFNQ